LAEFLLEKPVQMNTAVKNILTVVRSMLHIAVQLSTRLGSVRIKILRAWKAQNEIEDVIIGEDLLKASK